MFDVFNEDIEQQIKIGMANLYWYRNDLKKACLRSGVDANLCQTLFQIKHQDGRNLTKRELLDQLYIKLRDAKYDQRLEVSRNFARILIEHQHFSRQDNRHEIEKAEVAAFRLKELHQKQIAERDRQPVKITRAHSVPQKPRLDDVYQRFVDSMSLSLQRRGYELESIFTDLMKVYEIEVYTPFRITGEQLDGAIHYDGHYYLVEIKWRENQANQADIASLYLKAEGKLESRGIFISMSGYTNEVKQSIVHGKALKVLLFDGTHIANVLSGLYSFQALLNHAISEASLKGIIYCSPSAVS